MSFPDRSCRHRTCCSRSSTRRASWVEALVYGDLDPGHARRGDGTAPGRPPLRLRFQGFSRTLQQHATLVQFAVDEPPTNLSVGLPVTVIGASGDRGRRRLIVPRDAVVRSSNGEAIVWRHAEPEQFEPRPVRVTPFDATRVILAAGVSKDERIVVRAADLVNQVR